MEKRIPRSGATRVGRVPGVPWVSRRGGAVRDPDSIIDPARVSCDGPPRHRLGRFRRRSSAGRIIRPALGNPEYGVREVDPSYAATLGHYWDTAAKHGPHSRRVGFWSAPGVESELGHRRRVLWWRTGW